MKNDSATARDVTLQFAQALVDARFDDAVNLLTVSMQPQWPASRLQKTYQDMVASFEAPPQAVEIQETLDDWPAKQPADVAWIYVSISGNTQSEAVTVVVCTQESALCIRSIEWGRP